MPNLMERRNGNQRTREELGMYSPQSVLHAMDRFRSAVGSMENSVLVPCRLQDIPDPVMGDLYGAFKLLSRTKVDLLFGDENSQQSPLKLSRRPMMVHPAANGNSNKPSENGSSNESYSPLDTGKDAEKEEKICADGNATVALDPAMLKLHANLNQASIYCSLNFSNGKQNNELN
jgi:hypothetical protein